MDHLPIALVLKKQRCLIVGGGQIAYRKALLLVRAGAIVDIIAPKIADNLSELIETNHGCLIYAHFSPELPLKGYRLIIAATDRGEVNQQVFSYAEAENILVNSVDDVPNCRFMIPAIVDRSPLLISIASHGTSPVLSRQIRTQLEILLPQQLGKLAEFSGQWRPEVKAKIPNPEQRRIFWENLYESPLKEFVFSGQYAQANHLMEKNLKSWEIPKGEVYLVGAGPGDPELLTLKALRLMQQADVVFYDRLVSQPILDLCRRDAEKIYVGKARANHAVPQDQLNDLLVEYAKQGKRVCRLKGGDPFIFGRGGEEIEQICAAGMSCQIVPGITAASGCAAYAGISLTHRDYAQSVRFLTGHLKEGSPELPWSELVYENQTLVIYMGLVGLDKICQKLIAHGQRADISVALISRGTTPEQKVIVGTLADIADKVTEHQISAPTLTIIGDVVKMREKLFGSDV